jgi:peptidoglycan/xylan/chitin deacetylase (PgdA/CDA1 family)
MTRWKRFLLNLYASGSYPLRARSMARLCAAGQAPWSVLYYHRVADDRANPWTISTAAFEQQMHWLLSRFEMISLAEGQCRIRSGSNSRPAVTITFDDGYADNSRQALPLLLKLGIPCTYFVTSHNILTGRPFPHDVKLGHPCPPNTPAEIRNLAAAGIEIGAHTRTHADLGQVTDPRTLAEELALAQRELEDITAMPVRYFAFPYGQKANLGRAAMAVARSTYDGVCSAYGGYNFPGDDSFQIQRIGVDDELVRLRNWLSLDPRKLRASQSDRRWSDETFGQSQFPTPKPAELTEAFA